MPRFNQSSALLFTRFVEAGVTSPQELANVMGNASVETGGFSTMDERFGYRSVEQVVSAVSSAATRNTRSEIQSALDSHDPERVAHVLYDNRPGISNTSPGDGWKYHGRGYFQYTGKANYETFGHKFGYDLVNHPDMAADPETAAKLAIAYWKDRVPAADRTDAYASGVAINGGENGAEDRVTRSESWAKVITPELIQGVKDGSVSLEQLAAMGVDDHKVGHHPQTNGALRLGSTGAEVLTVQQQLAALDYRDLHGQPLQADRSFGPSTHAAVQAFQRDHHLNPDGVVGSVTRAALTQQVESQAKPAVRLDDPAHPDYAFFVQNKEHLCRLDSQMGRTSDQHTDNLAAALTVSARSDGLRRIDMVALSDDGSRLWAVQAHGADKHHLFDMRTSVDTMAALAPMEQSAMQWPHAMQKFQELQSQQSMQVQQHQSPQQQVPGIQ